MGYSLWGHKGSDTAEHRVSEQTHRSRVGYRIGLEIQEEAVTVSAQKEKGLNVSSPVFSLISMCVFLPFGCTGS